jgi:hypothetical protein
VISLLPIKLDDDKAERVRRNHHDAIKEQQRIVVSSDNVVTATLREGQETSVPHKLGRAPVAFFYSPIRGAVAAGRIDEVPISDQSKHIVLRAIGFGADITLKVLFV